MARTHGIRATYVAGCRCAECVTANTDYFSGWKATQKPLAADDPRHGRDATYNNYGCRCDRCAAAHLGVQAPLAERRRAMTLDPNDPRHGRYTTYSTYNCRCPKCRAAYSQRRRGQRAAAKASPETL